MHRTTMERGNEGQRWKKVSSYSFGCAQIFTYSKINTFKQLNNSNRLPQVNLTESIHRPEWGHHPFPRNSTSENYKDLYLKMWVSMIERKSSSNKNLKQLKCLIKKKRFRNYNVSTC